MMRRTSLSHGITCRLVLYHVPNLNPNIESLLPLFIIPTCEIFNDLERGLYGTLKAPLQSGGAWIVAFFLSFPFLPLS
jgi:hypothetical protein